MAPASEGRFIKYTLLLTVAYIGFTFLRSVKARKLTMSMTWSSVEMMCWSRWKSFTCEHHGAPIMPVAAALTLAADIIEGGLMANLKSERGKILYSFVRAKTKHWQKWHEKRGHHTVTTLLDHDNKPFLFIYIYIYIYIHTFTQTHTLVQYINTSTRTKDFHVHIQRAHTHTAWISSAYLYTLHPVGINTL